MADYKNAKKTTKGGKKNLLEWTKYLNERPRYTIDQPNASPNYSL